MYEQEFKYVFRLFTFVGMHPMKKMIKPLVIFNFVLTLYVTILILLRLLLNTDLLVVESVGVFSQVGISLNAIGLLIFQMIIVTTLMLNYFKIFINSFSNGRILELLYIAYECGTVACVFSE